MKKALAIIAVIIFTALSFFGCGNSTDNDDGEDYGFFTYSDIKDDAYFNRYLEEARKVSASEIIVEDVSYVRYHFLYKGYKPEICWYDRNNQEIEYLSYDGKTATRYIQTNDYQNSSLPSKNSNGDILVYREPSETQKGYCMYDENGRIVTEFSCGEDDSSEIYEYKYRSDGKVSQKTHIEIDYSDFSEDDEYEEVFASVHLNYFYDNYIYNSDDLLIRIESYKAGDKEPRSYEVFEYDDKNRIKKSYIWFDDGSVFYIDYYEYY